MRIGSSSSAQICLPPSRPSALPFSIRTEASRGASLRSTRAHWVPIVSTGSCQTCSAIHYPPSPPVLADGLFMHVAPFDKDQEADVEIPNINCAKCTLQVIEFMAAHGRNKDGDYTYHHCADLQIRANANKPIDTRFPAENTQR